MTRHCPLCNTPGKPFASPVYDDRFGYPGSFTPLHCERCDHGFLDHSFEEKDLTQLYTSYYPRSTLSIDNHRPFLERSGFKAWLDGIRSTASQWVPRDVRVLDVGCGGCESLGYHIARGCEAWGSEADANVAPLAEHFGYKVRIDFFRKEDFPDQYFDVVTLDQVIEHSVDPVFMMRDLSHVMRDDGFIVLTTPNLHGWGRHIFRESWINWHAPYHLQLFSKRSIVAAAHAAGLKAEIKTITSSEWVGYQIIHSLSRPQEGHKSLFWGGRSSLNWKTIRILDALRDFKIFHLTTRIMDAVGLGDNLVVVLKKERVG